MYILQADDQRYESVAKGLPGVSFSLGDSGDFLYGDCGEVSEAKKVLLESGDVIVFGGLSRLIFHGGGSTFRGTAPEGWSAMWPSGRLTLSFTEY